MNAKSRVISLLVAFVLAFGMFGGAAAEDVPVNVDLVDSTQLCYIMNFRAHSGTFGVWEYDAFGLTYFNTAPTSTILFWTDLFTPTWKGCDVTMSFGGLSNGVDLIGTENFSAQLVTWPYARAVDPAGFGDTGVGAGPYPVEIYDFEMTLNMVPLVPPGTYTGNINATISNTL
jgi:hypothetical protein